MIIKNGNIFIEDGYFKKGRIYIRENLVERIDLADICESADDDTLAETIDASGMYVLPGFVDIHLHGAYGYDFCDATEEAFTKLEEYQLENGITTIFPATMTLNEKWLEVIFTAAGEHIRHSHYEVMMGITVEGPFISSAKKGAQNEENIRKPDIGYFDKMQELCGGNIRQVTIAPEFDTYSEFILKVSKDVIVSLAHSEADYETAKTAFDNGASHVTHLFNGMAPFLHREPGIIGAAFDTQGVFVELICDGVHIHPSVVRAMFKLFGADRLCMISDSISATGMPKGEYSLGGQRVVVQDNKAVLNDGTIAGSICNLYECFKKTVREMKVPLEKAVLSCTKTPAKSLKVDDKCGILKEGRKADILILDEDLNIKYVLKNGKVVARR